MTIYIFLLLLIGLFTIIPNKMHYSKQSKKIFLFLSFGVMALIIGLRGQSVGEDTNHYIDMFRYSNNVSWSSVLWSSGFRAAFYTDQFGFTDTVESGFLSLAKFVNLITDEEQIFILSVAVITCSLFAKFIYDNCERVVFPTFIFLFESMFMLAFNGIRQILAVSIAIQAYKLIKEQKIKKAVFVIILAATIHNVALVSLLFILIMYLKPRNEYKSFKYVIIFSVLSPFLVMMGQGIIASAFPRYSSYFTTNYWSNSLGGIAILWALEVVMIIIQYKKHFKVEESFWLSCFVLFYLSCEFMGLRVTMFSRVGWFFRPYLILFIPICQYYFSKKNWKCIKLTLILLLILLYLSYAQTPARNYCFFWQ